MAFSATQKQVSGLIAKVDGRSLRNAVQAACIHVIGHAMEYGHSPLANALDSRMGSTPMTKKLAPQVARFLGTYGPFNYSESTGYVFSKAKRDVLNEEGYVWEEFSEAPPAFWDEDISGVKAIKAFDLFKAIESAVNRAAKKAAAGLCTDPGMIEYAQAFLGQYAGRKAVAAAQAAAKSTALTEAIRAELDAVEAETV